MRADAHSGTTDARASADDARPAEPGGAPDAGEDSGRTTDDAALVGESPDAALTWRESGGGSAGGCALAPRAPAGVPLVFVLGMAAGLGLRRRRPRA